MSVVDDLTREITIKAWQDSQFRLQLLESPERAVASSFPDLLRSIDRQIVVHVNTADVVHVVVDERPIPDGSNPEGLAEAASVGMGAQTNRYSRPCSRECA